MKEFLIKWAILSLFLSGIGIEEVHSSGAEAIESPGESPEVRLKWVRGDHEPIDLDWVASVQWSWQRVGNHIGRTELSKEGPKVEQEILESWIWIRIPDQIFLEVDPHGQGKVTEKNGKKFLILPMKSSKVTTKLWRMDSANPNQREQVGIIGQISSKSPLIFVHPTCKELGLDLSPLDQREFLLYSAMRCQKRGPKVLATLQVPGGLELRGEEGTSTGINLKRVQLEEGSKGSRYESKTIEVISPLEAEKATRLRIYHNRQLAHRTEDNLATHRSSEIPAAHTAVDVEQTTVDPWDLRVGLGYTRVSERLIESHRAILGAKMQFDAMEFEGNNQLISQNGDFFVRGEFAKREALRALFLFKAGLGAVSYDYQAHLDESGLYFAPELAGQMNFQKIQAVVGVAPFFGKHRQSWQSIYKIYYKQEYRFGSHWSGYLDFEKARLNSVHLFSMAMGIIMDFSMGRRF